MTTFTLSELANLLKADFQGDPDLLLTGVSTLDDAEAGDLSFLANPKYAQKLGHTRASAVVVEPNAVVESMAHIITPKPYHAFATAVSLFKPPTHPGSGVMAGSFVHPKAEVASGATVMPGAYVEAGALIGDGAVLYPGVYVGEGASIGKNTVLYPNVVVREGCVLGQRVIVQPGAIIGSDGFGFAMDEGGHLKFPQVGIVEIGDDVEIGACTTIDRAALGKTKIGRGVKIDNLVQVGHNVVIGQHSIIVSQCGLSGSSELGERVVMGGQSATVGHVKIGDRTQLGGRSGVTNNVEPGQVMQGYPLMGLSQWLRAQAGFKKLPEMRTRISDLEKRILALEGKKSKEEK